jgi:hypothetical protein
MFAKLLFDLVEACAQNFLRHPVELDERAEPVRPAAILDHGRT